MPKLKQFLDHLVSEYHRPEFLSSDPLEFVHGYRNPMDQEAVAVISAVLAYGNVKQIRKSISVALENMSQLSDSPREFVTQLKNAKFNRNAQQIFKNYVHRFNTGSDIVHLLSLISRSWSDYGSIGNHFLSFQSPHQSSPKSSKDTDISHALSSLVSQWREWLPSDAPPTFSYLLTSPADGSCCKRWCMFLRWMGRRDTLDPGLWTKGHEMAKGFSQKRHLESHQLVIPLDTHTGRISQTLKLTSRKSLNWKASLEVTRSLKKLDPQDPTRYDFAISRVGILDLYKQYMPVAVSQGLSKKSRGNLSET